MSVGLAENIKSEALVIGTPKVRSYSAFKCSIDGRDQFLRFELLRVLDIIDCNFKDGYCLQRLGDLLHLRYLGITSQGNDVPELPKQIGNLKLLQTLDVRGMLPESILHLTELVRLRAGEKVPDGIGKLVSLEELIILNGCSDEPKRFFKELGNLRELRVLQFKTDGMDESMQRDFVESLRNLQKLQYIVVDGSDWKMDAAMWEVVGFVLPRPLHYMDWYCIEMSKLPSCINPTSLPNLSHLELRVTTMQEQDLKLVSSLPVLCYLHLRTASTVTASNINSVDGCFFQKLRYFMTWSMVQFEQPNEEDTSVLLHMWNGKDAIPFGSRKSNDSRKVVPSGVMPNLEILNVDIPLWALKDNNSDCGNIRLEYLPSLRELRGRILCRGLPTAEIDAAFAALRNACNVHPNHPTFGMEKNWDY